MALATEDDLKSWMRENRTSSSERGSDIPSHENTFKMKGVSSCLLDCQWILAHDQETGEGTIRLAGSTDRYNGDQLSAVAVAVGRVIDLAE